VSDSAFSWGFNDAAHFSRAFKERFSVTPREFGLGLAR
jgi:AraC-like DNA-binding protein